MLFGTGPTEAEEILEIKNQSSEIETENQSQDSRSERIEILRQQAKDRLDDESDDDRAEIRERALNVRVDACQQRQAKVSQRMELVHQRGQELAEKIDDYVKRLESFVDNHNLADANYTRLLGQLEESRQSLRNMSEILLQLRASFECDDPDGARATLEAFRQQTDEVRTQARLVIDQLGELKDVVKQAYQEVDKR